MPEPEARDAHGQLPWRLALLAVALVLLAINIGFGVVGPLAPRLALAMGGTKALVAGMFSLFSATRVAVQLPGGVLADRIGDCRLLLLSLVLYGVSTVGLAATEDVLVFTAMRGLEGVAAGLSFPAASAIVLRTAPATALGRSVGWIAGGAGLGLIVGPLLGGGLLHLGLRVPLWTSAALSLLVLLLVLPLLGRGPLTRGQRQPPRSLRQEGGRLLALLRQPAFFAALCPIALNKLLISGLEPLMPIFGPEVLGISLEVVTYLFAGTAVVYALTQPLGGWMADRLPLRPQILLLMALMLAALAALAPWRTLPAFVGPYAVTIGAMSLVFAACIKQIGLGFGDQIGPGQLFGVVGMLTDAAMMVGPPLMVGLYAATSGGRVFAWTAAVGLPVWLFMLGFRPRLPGEELEQRG